MCDPWAHLTCTLVLVLPNASDALPVPHLDRQSSYALIGNILLMIIMMMILASLLLPLSMHYHEDVFIQNSSIRFPTFEDVRPLFL